MIEGQIRFYVAGGRERSRKGSFPTQKTNFINKLFVTLQICPHTSAEVPSNGMKTVLKRVSRYFALKLKGKELLTFTPDKEKQKAS